MSDFEKLRMSVPSETSPEERLRRYAEWQAAERERSEQWAAVKERARVEWANLPRSESQAGLRSFKSLRLRPEVLGLAEAEKAVRSWIAGNSSPWLLLTGPYGVGKSHLAEAAARELVTASREVRWQSVVSLLADLRRTYSTNEDAEARLERVANTPWLVLDDLGRERVTEWSQERLFWLIEERQTRRMRTLVTTNLTREGMEKQIGGAIADRVFDEGSAIVTVVTLNGRSYRTGR